MQQKKKKKENHFSNWEDNCEKKIITTRTLGIIFRVNIIDLLKNLSKSNYSQSYQDISFLITSK